MVKKIQNSKSNPKPKTIPQSILHNVYLLYFLFIATLIHLGYFIFTQESTLLASFSLAILFIYLVNPNMVVVLATSLIFVDMLYLVKKVPEGFDSSGESVSDIDASGIDVSGANYMSNKEETTKPLTFTNLVNKVNEIRQDAFENRTSEMKDNDAVNPLVGVKGVLKEKMTGNSIQEVDKDFVDVKSMINTIKDSSPELSESLKSLNSIDINEVNKLINQLSDMTKKIKNGV